MKSESKIIFLREKKEERYLVLYQFSVIQLLNWDYIFTHYLLWKIFLTHLFIVLQKILFQGRSILNIFNNINKMLVTSLIFCWWNESLPSSYNKCYGLYPVRLINWYYGAFKEMKHHCPTSALPQKASKCLRNRLQEFSQTRHILK